MERDGAEARVGITQYAADALGDVVFAELPEQGRQVLLYILDVLWPSVFHIGPNNMQIACTQPGDFYGLAYEQRSCTPHHLMLILVYVLH